MAAGSALSQQQLQILRQRFGTRAVAREQPHAALGVEDVAGSRVVDRVVGFGTPRRLGKEDLEVLGRGQGFFGCAAQGDEVGAEVPT